jgi:hypothetical protein
MITPLQPPDSLHLQAAEGWVGLRDFAAANNELEEVAPVSRCGWQRGRLTRDCAYRSGDTIYESQI